MAAANPPYQDSDNHCFDDGTSWARTNEWASGELDVFDDAGHNDKFRSASSVLS